MPMRTDLAMEAAARRGRLSPEDVTISEQTVDRIALTRMEIRSERGERVLHKPRGRYVTVHLPPLTDNDTELLTYARLIGRELAAMLPPEGTVLVVGLGNPDMTADALGPQTARRVLATRHIEEEYARASGLTDLRSVAVVTAGICGHTGVESTELLKGLCGSLHPAAIVAVDALAAASADRLGRTVQITDSGISPGSGVGNRRERLCREQLGVPVLALGVPTVADIRTLVAGLSGMELAAELFPTPLIVTPQEIDLLIRRAARLLAMGLHAALQPAYSPLELLAVTE